MIQSYHIEEINITDLTDEQLSNYYEYTKSLFVAQFPDDPIPTIEKIIKELKANLIIENFIYRRYMVYGQSGKIVGYATMRFPTEDNTYLDHKHIVQANMNVHPDYRRQGIGTRLLAKMIEFGLLGGKTIIEGETDDEAGREFCQNYDATISLEGVYNRLQLDQIDWGLMNKWKKVSEEELNDCTITTFTEVPEHMLDEYCDILNQLENLDVPLGEIESRETMAPKDVRLMEEWFKERGETCVTMISREKNGEASGMTDIIYNKFVPYKIVQGLTGVYDKYRGKGLGKWLKANMALYIRKHYPNAQYIETHNADVNAPMLYINNKMGFKKHRTQSNIKFEIEQ